MHFKGLDLNLLVALDALLTERNVTTAAERIHISQPGMSAALQRLRYHFDDVLLERIGRKLELTPRAELLAQPVKEILALVRLLNEPPVPFDPQIGRRSFRILATDYCSELLAGPIFAHLQSIDSSVGLQFSDLSIDSFDRIIDGRVDFAIMISAGLFDNRPAQSQIFESRTLFRDHFVVAISNDHPYRGETISFDDLCNIDHVETRFESTSSGIGISEQLWKQQPKQPNICGWLPNFHVTLDVVGRTRLATILPSRVADLRRGRYNIRSLPAPFEIPNLEERLYWHKRNNNDVGHQWMAGVLQQVASAIHPVSKEPMTDFEP